MFYFKKLFTKKINPYEVTDEVIFHNVENDVTMFVRADAMALVVGIKKAKDYLLTLKDDSPLEEKRKGALMIATALFGAEQADILCGFYEDPLTVVGACGKYLQRLVPKIDKVQRKNRKKKK